MSTGSATSFPQSFYRFLEENTLIEIKGGRERNTFLKIWMVAVGERVFARSWNRSKRSWFTEFILTGEGEIKYENEILQVKGRKLPPDDEIQSYINTAYLEKYVQEENKPYVIGITQKEYADYTMEFFAIGACIPANAGSANKE